MKKNFWIAILLLPLLFACKKTKQEEAITLEPEVEIDTLSTLQKVWAFDSLSAYRKVYIDNDTTKPGMEVDLSFRYPISVPDSIDLSKIQGIFNKVFSNKDGINDTPNNVFGLVVDEYQLYAKDYAEEWKKENNEAISFSAFEQSKSTGPKFISKYIMSIVTGEYSFLGGAHGAYSIKYDNIDLFRGIPLKQDGLFKQGYNKELATLIQNKIAEHNASPKEEDHIYLLVRLQDIKPNDNFFFSPNGITYVYNQYEIAPYAQGFIELEIPYKDILPLVNDRYKSIIEGLTK